MFPYVLSWDPTSAVSCSIEWPHCTWTSFSQRMGSIRLGHGWFADRVQSDDKIVTFFWGKTEHRDAEIIAVRAFSFIRFRWLDDEYEREYFELKMTNNELTNDFVLEVTDFAVVDEVKDLCELWDSQVDTLRRTCGF